MPVPRSLARFSARRVRQRIRRGSSLPVVVETEAGLFLTKLRGSGQGVPALIAEILVAELAESLGLPVPERVLVDLPAAVPSDDRNDELAQLLDASTGTNLGFRWLEGARDPRPEDLARLDDDFAARVLWLDGLTMNPDRTVQNPNILLWKRQPWLIDHGAALTFHHDWSRVTEGSPRERTTFGHHVFEDRGRLLERYDPLLAKRLDRASIEAAAAMVPDELLTEAQRRTSAARTRAAYTAFLWKRAKTPRPFLPSGDGVGPVEKS